MQLHLIPKTFLLFVHLFISCTILSAQTEEITVTGTMIDGGGEAIPGVSIVIEGTTEGTIADFNGNYSIKAPLGSTLIFSFVGMRTQRAIVTRTGLNPEGTRQIIPYNTQTESTRYIREKEVREQLDSVRYHKRMKRYKEYLADSLILQQYKREQKSAIVIEEKRQERKLRKYIDPNRIKFYQLGDIEVESQFSVEEVGRTPNLQSVFAQGTPLNGELTYQGPATGNAFSWGPRLRNLEYDGITNSYDENGSLVKKGYGSGKPAFRYNHKDVFKTGFSRLIGITTYQTIKGARLNLSYRNQFSSGILNAENYSKHSFRINLELPKGINVKASYSNKEDNFKDGALRSRVISSAYLTPISFDNTNGLSIKDAQKQSGSIYQSNGNLRSAAEGSLNNPYYLTQKVKNKSTTESLLYNIDHTFRWNTGNVKTDFSSEFFTNKKSLFYPRGIVGLSLERSSAREEKIENHFVTASVQNRILRDRLLFKVPLRGEFYNYQLDAQYNQQPIHLRRDRKIFTTNPHLQLKQKYHYKDIYLIKAGMNIYTSSTSNKTYYKPNIGLYFKPFEFLDKVFSWNTDYVMENFKLLFDYAAHINEYYLNSQSGLSNSLRYNVADFNSYFEDLEIGAPNNIQPELITKRDFSIEASFLHGKIQSETSFYSNHREQSIFPILENNMLNYKNVGNIKTWGWEESVTARLMNGIFRWSTKMTLAQSVSEVTHLNRETPIAIAGFKDVHTALVKGKAPGVIRGNTFLRDTDGRKIIGDDGFPLVDPTLSVIGDPNPDLLMGLSNTFNLNGMELGFTIDCTFGGDVWNGTQASLDYYGVSEITAKERSVTDYIFDGVKQNGSINNTIVDFAPKQGSVYNNKWVRYGQAGVAENYIEDGTRVMLKELYFTYHFNVNTIRRWGLERLSLSLMANNLVTISGYRGNLASNTLWGHSNTLGLDYFNSPPIRRYGASLKVTF